MSPLRQRAPHLFAHWGRVIARVRASRRIALFLDFDGTLVRIAPRPDRVRLTLGMRRALKNLARHPRVTLLVISGRRRGELSRQIGIRGVRYIGLYGWQSEGRNVLPAAARAALRQAGRQLTVHLAAFPKIWVENKRDSLSVHLLDASAKVQTQFRRRLRYLLRPFKPRLRLFENLRDVEIVPRGIPDKGVAVQRVLKAPALRGALPVYIGDDLSDEPAFAALRRGIAICVGPGRRTRAHYSLRSPGEVAGALRKLEAALS